MSSPLVFSQTDDLPYSNRQNSQKLFCFMKFALIFLHVPTQGRPFYLIHVNHFLGKQFWQLLFKQKSYNVQDDLAFDVEPDIQGLLKANFRNLKTKSYSRRQKWKEGEILELDIILTLRSMGEVKIMCRKNKVSHLITETTIRTEKWPVQKL